MFDVCFPYVLFVCLLFVFICYLYLSLCPYALAVSFLLKVLVFLGFHWFSDTCLTTWPADCPAGISRDAYGCLDTSLATHV